MLLVNNKVLRKKLCEWLFFKKGGTEIDRWRTFEKSSFTKSKKLDLIYHFPFKTWRNNRWILKLVDSLCLSIDQKFWNFYDILLLRNSYFKVIISQCFEAQQILEMKCLGHKFNFRYYFSKPSFKCRLLVATTAEHCTLAATDIFNILRISKGRGIYWPVPSYTAYIQLQLFILNIVLSPCCCDFQISI